MKKTSPRPRARRQDAAGARALPGKFPRPITLGWPGAGRGFRPRPINDGLHIRGTIGGALALVAIEAARWQTMANSIRRL